VDHLEDVEESLHEDIPLPLHTGMARYKIRVDRLEDVEESLHEDIPLPLHMARCKIRVDRLEDVEETLKQDIEKLTPNGRVFSCGLIKCARVSP
jgi:5'-deoxynucleotidase YfbR-like HD superfamily hydrolase